MIAIGDVCNIVGGGTPSRTNEAFFGGSTPWATVRDMKSDWIEVTEFSITEEAVRKSTTNILPAGAVVVASRVGLGKVCRVRQPTAINQDLRGFLPKKCKEIDEQYLFHWFRSAAHRIVAAGTGATVQGVTLPFLRSLKLPLPPLDEQRRIVAVLDEAFAAIATATANAEKDKAALNGLLSNLIDSILAAEPDRTLMTLADAADPTCTLSYGIVQPGSDVEGGLPIVRPVDLRQKIVGLDGLKRIDPTLAASYKRTTLKGGEVLLCVRGTTGVLSLASDELSGANVTRGIVPIRFKSDLIGHAFGYFLMRSGAIQKQIRAATYGTALMQINIADLRKVKIEVPRFERQAVLRERLDRLSADIEDLQENCARKIAASMELQQSLLRQAFSGDPIGAQLLAA